MKSFQLTRAMKKLGFIPVSEDENGCIRINLLNPAFLAQLTVRGIIIGAYLYFIFIYAHQQEMSIPMVVVLSFDILGTCGTFVYSFLMALAAKRLENNTFTGESQMTGKTLITMITPQLLFSTGTILSQLPLLTLDISWISKCGLCITLIFVDGITLLDMFLMVSASYLWVLDLKTKIAVVLNLEKSENQIENFEKINNDYLSLKRALEPITFSEFSFVQILCIVSVYLAFKGTIFFMNPIAHLIMCFTSGHIFSLLQFLGMLMLLVLMVSVLSDLYELMEEVANKAEETGLEQSNLFSMFRYI